jgi:hypothetical protein
MCNELNPLIQYVQLLHVSLEWITIPPYININH